MSSFTRSTINKVFENRIREADVVSREFKAPQVTSGASGQLAFSIQNETDWDLTLSLPFADPVSPRQVELVVTYTGDGTQDYPTVVPITDIRVNGTGESNKVAFSALMMAWVYGASGSDRVIVYEYDLLKATTVQNKTVLQWRIMLYYERAPTIRFKLRASSTCPGTLSIVRTI